MLKSIDALLGRVVQDCLGSHLSSSALEELSDESNQSVFISRTLEEGLQPLLYYRLKESEEGLAYFPETIRRQFSAEAKHQVLLEDLRFSEATTVLQRLRARNVVPIVFKGGGLAYTEYPEPSTRPRSDTDLFIQKGDSNAVFDVMGRLGYKEVLGIKGDLVRTQVAFTKEDSYGVSHHFDFHWRISNPQVFANLLTYDEVLEEARQTGLFCCLSFSRRHALLMALIHRVAHHGNSENLLWLYDIHLLTHQQSIEWFVQFWQMVQAKQVTAVCAKGLQLSQKFFGTRLENDESLDLFVKVAGQEASAWFLNPDRTLFHEVWYDLRYSKSLKARLGILQAHLFPSKQYMLHKYKTNKSYFIPYLYLQRIVCGFGRKLIKKPWYLSK